MTDGESRIRILIVDDQEIFRVGLVSALSSEDDFEVVGQASNAEQALAGAKGSKPDVILMDVRLSSGGDTDGIEACRDILSAQPDMRVLMLSSYGEQDVVFSAVMAGAAGYLVKRVGRVNLCEAIRRVAGGETLLDPAVTQSVLDAFCTARARARRVRFRSGRKRCCGWWDVGSRTDRSRTRW